MSQQNEIEFFNALAHEWWDINGPQAMLHKINPIRIRWMGRHVNLANLKVLDVGCGAGLLSEALATKNAKVTGIDLGDELIAVAKRHAEESNLAVDYHCVSLDDFAKDHNEVFDCVTCLEMLEHVEDYATVIQNIAQVLKPGGKVFFSTLDRNPKAFVEAIVGAEYVLNLVPRGTHHYQQFIRPDELTCVMRVHCLEPKSLEGLKYHPLLKTFSLGPKLQTNYWVVGEKN